MWCIASSSLRYRKNMKSNLNRFTKVSLFLAILVLFHLFSDDKNIKPTTHNRIKDTDTACELFKGQWIEDARGPLYTNYSCKTIPILRNCLLNGRTDTDFLYWRWKPDQCELARFRPEEFLTALRGKTMAFIGDSMARNHMESLLCLLSTVETPTRMQEDPEDRSTTREFPGHNFTLMALWSPFLVSSTERFINGSSTGAFDLYLDRADPTWSEMLPSIDYAIFSDAHWFFRQNYLYEGGKLVGCVYCKAPGVPDLGPGLAIRKAFRAAFKAVNDCGTVFGVLRTYSPSHFEHGTWNDGGVCNRTRPTRIEEEVKRGEVDWEYRTIQVEEVERARGEGEENRFGILDVTRMMSVRRDGHPNVHWGNEWMKGYRDCIHWCLPGPADVWNQLLFELIKRKVS